MVRWVFRPYTQVRRQRFARQFRTTQASTKFSPGFTMSENSSPSFGSQLICSAGLISHVRALHDTHAYGQISPHIRNQPMLHPRINKLRIACNNCFRFAVCNAHMNIRYDSQSSWTPWSVFQDGSDSCASFHEWNSVTCNVMICT